MQLRNDFTDLPSRGLDAEDYTLLVWLKIFPIVYPPLTIVLWIYACAS